MSTTEQQPRPRPDLDALGHQRTALSLDRTKSRIALALSTPCEVHAAAEGQFCWPRTRAFCEPRYEAASAS